MQKFLCGCLILCTMLIGAAARAQAPAAVPEKMPFDVAYGMPITLERAKQVAAAAEAEAKRRDWKFVISIVDTHGDPVYFLKMDGAQTGSVTVAPGKAKTAARYRRPTQIFFNAMESGHPYVATLDPTVVASPGGNPIIEGGRIIGAIGVSGGTGDQDNVVSLAGAAAVK